MNHPNCRCYIEPRPEWLNSSQRKFWEDGLKMQARLLLSQYDQNKRLMIPTEEEWIGLNLLERETVKYDRAPCFQTHFEWRLHNARQRRFDTSRNQLRV